MDAAAAAVLAHPAHVESVGHNSWAPAPCFAHHSSTTRIAFIAADWLGLGVVRSNKYGAAEGPQSSDIRWAPAWGSTWARQRSSAAARGHTAWALVVVDELGAGGQSESAKSIFDLALTGHRPNLQLYANDLVADEPVSHRK